MAGTIIGSFGAAQQELRLKPTLPVSLELLPTEPGNSANSPLGTSCMYG